MSADQSALSCICDVTQLFTFGCQQSVPCVTTTWKCCDNFPSKYTINMWLSSDEESEDEADSSQNLNEGFEDSNCEKSVRLLHINAQSIRGKLDFIQAESNLADIITVTETWLSDEITNDTLRIENYSGPYRKDRDGGYHGGVAIYIKENLLGIHREDLNQNGLEGTWLETFIGQTKSLIGVIYRPPNSTVDIWDKVSNFIEGAKLSGIGTIFITGDLNCDLLIPDSKLERIFADFNLEQLITEPTHYTPTSATLIDIIATSSLDLVIKAEVLGPSLSNHCDIMATIRTKCKPPKTITRSVYSYKNVNWTTINNIIQNTDWNGIVTKNDIDEICEAWTRKYLEIINGHIPNRAILTNRLTPNWMTGRIKQCIRQRNRQHRKAKRTNKPQDWEKFRKIRNDTQNEVRRAKEDWSSKIQKKIEECVDRDEKLWWKIVKDHFNHTKNTSSYSPPLLINGKPSTNDLEKAEAFNQFFSEASQIDESQASNLPPVADPPNLSNLRIPSQTVYEVLSMLKQNKASGPDSISPRMLKMTAISIAPSLARIFNFSLATGTVPHIWKLANITPLHKKGDKHLVKNFRPISLLSVVGKCLERCIHKVLHSYLLENGLISQLQTAYMPETSTTCQLLDVYHRIIESMDRGMEIRFIFLDISKAFDRVWHKGLLYKLQVAGVGGKLLSWLENYLTNRAQRVVVAGECSKTTKITAGVPQGSILGPTLFILYVNDLLLQLGPDIRMYADDVTLFVTYKNSVRAAEDLQFRIDQASTWADKWLINFNPQKSISLKFSRKRESDNPPVSIKDVVITESISHKHLGITLQNNGKWNDHITEIIGRAQKRVDILRGLMFRLDRRSLEKLYISFVRPILEYSDVVWDNITDQQSTELEAVQLAAARVITGGKRGSSHALLYSDTKLQLLAERRKQHKLIMMQKIVNKKVPSSLIEILPPNATTQHSYNTRSREHLLRPPIATTSFEKSFFPSTIKTWNELPQNVKECKNLETFKELITPDTTAVSPHYYVGQRKYQIYHTRIRLQNCDLNKYLFDRNLRDTPSCVCGQPAEDAHHFFFECVNYVIQRTEMFGKLTFINNPTLTDLLKGREDLTVDENKNLFTIVQTFIRKTKRFD